MGDTNIFTLSVLHKHGRVLFDVGEVSEQNHTERADWPTSPHVDWVEDIDEGSIWVVDRMIIFFA